MIHHDTILAKYASESGGAGHFEIIESEGEISVVEEGTYHIENVSSLAAARGYAQGFADAFDKRKLDELKANWKADPHWDLEATEGFEDYRQELSIFRLETELEAARKELSETNAALRALAGLLRPYLSN
jgi:hypothetical protein